MLDKPHQVLGQGVCSSSQGRFAEAEKPLREALRMDPTLAEGHYNLAIVLRNEGRSTRRSPSTIARSMASRREPDRAKAFYGIGLAREARGDKGAWDDYLAFARPLRGQQPAVKIAEYHRDVLNGVKVPGSYQKAAR